MSNNPYEPQTQNPGVNPNLGQPEPAKSGGCLKIALIVLGLGILCCGLCGGGIYWVFGQLGSSVQAQFETHPIIKEKLGGIDSCKFSLEGMANYAKENPDEKRIMVFAVTGPKGSGEIVGRQDPANGQKLINAKLLMDGEEYPLD